MVLEKAILLKCSLALVSGIKNQNQSEAYDSDLTYPKFMTRFLKPWKHEVDSGLGLS